MKYDDIDLEEIQKRVQARSIASDVLFNLETAWFWVRDSRFKWLDISEKASDILYWRKSDDCIGLTDLEIAEESEYLDDPEMFCRVCRTSDQYVLENPQNQQYNNYTFIEFIEDVYWNKHIWKTTKGIHPRQVRKGKEYYHYWMALFIDEMYWDYDLAYKWFEKQLKNNSIKKINNWLYVYE